MSVRAVGIVNNGRVLLSRQLVRLSRFDTELLFSSFSSGLEVQKSTDKSYFEAGDSLFVYQSFNSGHIVVVGERGTNLLECTEALKTIARLVHEICRARKSEASGEAGGSSGQSGMKQGIALISALVSSGSAAGASPDAEFEQLVASCAFSIIFAIDELFSMVPALAPRDGVRQPRQVQGLERQVQGGVKNQPSLFLASGVREPLTMAQVNQYIDMESHEERLHQLITQSKEQEARETAKRKQKELDELKREQSRGRSVSNEGLGPNTPARGGSGRGPSGLSGSGNGPSRETSISTSAFGNSGLSDEYTGRGRGNYGTQRGISGSGGVGAGGPGGFGDDGFAEASPGSRTKASMEAVRAGVANLNVPVWNPSEDSGSPMNAGNSGQNAQLRTGAQSVSGSGQAKTSAVPKKGMKLGK